MTCSSHNSKQKAPKSTNLENSQSSRRAPAFCSVKARFKAIWDFVSNKLMRPWTHRGWAQSRSLLTPVVSADYRSVKQRSRGEGGVSSSVRPLPTANWQNLVFVKRERRRRSCTWWIWWTVLASACGCVLFCVGCNGHLRENVNRRVSWWLPGASWWFCGAFQFSSDFRCFLAIGQCFLVVFWRFFGLLVFFCAPQCFSRTKRSFIGFLLNVFFSDSHCCCGSCPRGSRAWVARGWASHSVYPEDGVLSPNWEQL